MNVLAACLVSPRVHESTHWRYGRDSDSFSRLVLMESSEIVPTRNIS